MEIFAGKGNGGTTTLSILEESGNGFVSVGSVGIVQTGWQSYVSYTTQVNFSNTGLQKLRFEFNGGANVRDFNFTLPSSNTPPIVNITAPDDGVVAESDYSINFTGTANDTQDGDLSANIVWTSDIDGFLGSGTSITTTLSEGTHIVTAEVQDEDANPLTGSATKTIVIVSPSPVCDVEYRVNAGGPSVLSNSGNFEEDQAAFSADAGSSAEPGTPSPYVNLTSPAEDKTYGAIGSLTNTTGYPDYLFQTERYSESANPNNMNWSFPTGNGVYQVKLLFNENWTGEINDPRVFDVMIEDELALDDYRPSGVSGAEVNVAKVESFEATVTDGVLNVNFIKGSQNPSVKGFDICFVSDLPTDTPPVVTISAPTNNLTPISINRMVETTFTATVEDAEDDNATLTNNLVWTINPFEPNFAGTGGTFEDTIFVPGVYTIRASSTDSDNNTSFDEIQVTVLGPDVEITAPEENAVLTTTDVRVEWTAANLNYIGATPEHFHIWVNPVDPNNLIDGERISTASFPGQLYWELTTADGIVEGINTVVIIAADNGHDEFENIEARDLVTFTVTSPDGTAPVITLLGDNPLEVLQGGTYTDPGATAFDNFDGDISDDIVVGGDVVDVNTIASYTITYNVVDAANNAAVEVTRIVNVVEPISVGNGELIVLNATDDTPLFDLTEGLQIGKATIGNTPLGIVFNPSLNPGAVRYTLTGPLSETRTEGSAAPYSLFGDIGVDVQGKVFPVGNYTLVADPNVGPTITVNFSVTDINPLCANFDASLTGIVNPSVCSGLGSAMAVPSGGASPFTYQWDNGETTATANNLSIGAHSVVVRDANGCSKTLTFNLTGPSLPVVTLAPFSSVLNTDPAFTLTGGSPAGGAYSGPGVNGSTFDPSIGIGNYVITYSYTDINGCSNSASRSITVTSETSNAALVVLDATTDAPLYALTEGLQIGKATIGNTPLGIVFNPSLNPGAVRYTLTGPLSETRTEGSAAPYSLFGDIGVDVQGKVFPVGNYTLVADPNVGPTITVNFSVIDGISNNQFSTSAKIQVNEMSISPNPANEEVTISFDEPTPVKEILIFDITGRLIKTLNENLRPDGKSIDFNVYDLPIGTYFIKTVDSNGKQHQQQMLIDRY